jgi:hypothetical protein
LVIRDEKYIGSELERLNEQENEEEQEHELVHDYSMNTLPEKQSVREINL